MPPGMPPVAETIEQSELALHTARQARLALRSEGDPTMHVMLAHSSFLPPMGSTDQPMESQLHETSPLETGDRRLSRSQQGAARRDEHSTINISVPLQAESETSQSVSRIVMPTALERSRQDAIMLRI